MLYTLSKFYSQVLFYAWDTFIKNIAQIKHKIPI